MAEPEVPSEGLRFGTDGIRGRAGTRIVDSVVRALGRAAADLLGSDRVFVGLDTRESGPGLSRALAEGFAAGGLDVVQLGVVPTPAVAHLAAAEGAAAAMVTASHNPWWDNGVKLFSAGGLKLDGAIQAAVQEAWDALPVLEGSPAAVGWSDDRAVEGAQRWVDAVVGSVRPGALDGLAVVVDCANGATSGIAGPALERLGADVTVIHSEPDGRNINDGCGSTHPAALQAAVTAIGADAGLAFDGDGDRVLAVGHDGTLVDGDDLLAVIGVDRHERGLLPGSTVVVTVMANLGLRRALADNGIAVLETAVGDRYVLEALEAEGLTLGGEQSGHVIFRDLATTGDGLLTGIQALDAACRAGRTLGERVAELVVRAPQVLHSVPVEWDGEALVDLLASQVATAVAELGDLGRVLVRASGTEPVVRVMVEAFDMGRASAVADHLVEAVKRADRT